MKNFCFCLNTIPAKKAACKAWRQSKAESSLHSRWAEAWSPLLLWQKSPKCSHGRISDISWIPITGKPTNCFFYWSHATRLICLPTTGSRSKPKQCFLLRRLRWTLLPKEHYGESLSGRGSNTQPSNWETDTLPLSLVASKTFFSKGADTNSLIFVFSNIDAVNYKAKLQTLI